jgi:hypothetical protein
MSLVAQAKPLKRRLPFMHQGSPFAPSYDEKAAKLLDRYKFHSIGLPDEMPYSNVIQEAG